MVGHDVSISAILVSLPSALRAARRDKILKMLRLHAKEIETGTIRLSVLVKLADCSSTTYRNNAQLIQVLFCLLSSISHTHIYTKTQNTEISYIRLLNSFPNVHLYSFMQFLTGTFFILYAQTAKFLYQANIVMSRAAQLFSQAVIFIIFINISQIRFI